MLGSGGKSLMFEFLVTKLIAPGLAWIFGAGVVGCVIVIPVCAYKMLRVLFEQDAPDAVTK